MKILIIDPDEYYHELFRNNVADAAELFFSQTETQALEMLDLPPDLIVSELIFNDGHAYNFFPKIRNIPFIVYTKIGHLEDVESSLSLGASAYLVKGHDSINDIKKLTLSYAI